MVKDRRVADSSVSVQPASVPSGSIASKSTERTVHPGSFNLSVMIDMTGDQPLVVRSRQFPY